MKLEGLANLSEKTKNPISVVIGANEVLAKIDPNTLHSSLIQEVLPRFQSTLARFIELYSADNLLTSVKAILAHERLTEERCFPTVMTERFTDRKSGKTSLVDKVPHVRRPADSLNRAVTNASSGDFPFALIKNLPVELQVIRLEAQQILDFMNRKADA